MKDNKLHTPDGVKDYLPLEYAVKKELERRMEAVFLRYGYRCISSPMFEYMEVFDGKGSVDAKQMYKFLDRDGSILSLRADMTLAIARIASTAYDEKDMPLRFCYFENAFRYKENYQGKLKEFTQAGIELIGVNSIDADAEIIAIAINSLLATGLQDFKIYIGQVEFFNGLLEGSDFSDEEFADIQRMLVNKEYVGVEKVVMESNLSPDVKDLIIQFPLLIGDKRVIDKVKGLTKNERAQKALHDLETMYDILCGYGLDQYILFDLGMVGYLDYYSGLIFRGYTQGTGVTVIGGGRYDKLISKFGADYPSVGFAIKVNELLNSLENKNIEVEIPVADTLLAFADAGRNTALYTADELRSQGLFIENSLVGADIEANIRYAKEKNIGGILYFIDEKTVVLHNLIDNTSKEVSIEELLKESEE